MEAWRGFLTPTHQEVVELLMQRHHLSTAADCILEGCGFNRWGKSDPRPWLPIWRHRRRENEKPTPT